MSKEYDSFLKEVSTSEMKKTIEWLTSETPYRLAGSPMQKKAAEYIVDRMKQYGLDSKYEEFYTYNSDPISSSVEIIAPINETIKSLPIAHIRSTKPEGETFELIYVGDGSEAKYDSIDVTGKFVLVEVSYAPPVPEKARIAYAHGAVGIMCMNWGNDEEVICCRAIKAVWGNPTEDTVKDIPDLIGVGITRNAGLKLKALCLEGEKVLVKIQATASRMWSKVQQPFGILRGNGRSNDFVLIASHLDAWKPGVTCNATGNATALELCRILSEHREQLDRDIWFTFWSGHEIAEAAGSTWFIDNHWRELNKHCVCYMHIDSTGVRETELNEIKASRELLDFARENYYSVEGNKKIRAMSLKKIGDQSFMGIGVPSITQRISFTEEYMKAAHGATLGWWNHTCEDGLDKCDYDILRRDTKIHLRQAMELASIKLLPYKFDQKFDEISDVVSDLNEEYGSKFYMEDLLDELASAKNAVSSITGLSEQLLTENAEIYNSFVKNVCRNLINVYMTYTNKYSQDSYGFGKLSNPLPLLSDLSRLNYYEESSFEYGLIHTELTKNKNRILDALYQIEEICDAIKGTLR